MYFQWGDTQGYTADQVGKDKQFASDWSDYKWRLSGNSFDNIAFTKYTTKGSKLNLEDDAAHVNMGGDWHMPTPEQIKELISTANTTTAFTTFNGVSGMTFTSKKDTSRSIFIPAAGYASDGSVQDSGDKGLVLSSLLSAYIAYSARFLNSNSDYANVSDGGGRFDGLSVRGVIG